MSSTTCTTIDLLVTDQARFLARFNLASLQHDHLRCDLQLLSRHRPHLRPALQEQDSAHLLVGTPGKRPP